jgi:DNA-binding response OmpR family regulator
MPRLMIVDDDTELSNIYATFLQEAGHTVATHATLADALAKIRTFRPDLLILDMMFPENPLGGQALARDIRHDQGLRNLPIIFLTSVYEYFPLTFPSDPQQDCRPIQDFIDKPVAIPELLRRVADVLRSPTYTPSDTP